MSLDSKIQSIFTGVALALFIYGCNIYLFSNPTEANNARTVVVPVDGCCNASCSCNTSCKESCEDTDSYKVSVPRPPCPPAIPKHLEATSASPDAFASYPMSNVIHNVGTYAISGGVIINTHTGKVVAYVKSTKKGVRTWVYTDDYGNKGEFTPYRAEDPQIIEEVEVHPEVTPYKREEQLQTTRT